jgi:transposase-like protein
MRKIIINAMHLLNFKGARDLTVKFDGQLTEIYGDNGVGKSTIVDAFCWVLFGKDATDRKDFSLKTLDENGVAIPRLPHEVTVQLSVDGAAVTLTRKFNEKWTKTKGEATEHFAGHEEERLYNDVPCSLKDWKEKVTALCDEEVFKYVTNPLYFATRKEDTQRALLFKMAGGVSDDDVAGDNKDYRELLQSLSGKTMEEYKKEIAAKKRIVKADVESIPERIDERKRSISEVADITADEKELADKKKALADIEAQLADKSKAYSAASDAKMALARERQVISIKRIDRAAELTKALMADSNAAADVRDGILRSIERSKQQLQTINAEIQAYSREHEQNLKRRNELKHIYQDIEQKIATADAPMDESMFVCPTCGRRYEMEEIESKRESIMQKYLSELTAAKTANVEEGQKLKVRRDQIEQQLTTLSSEVDKLSAQIVELENDPRLKAAAAEAPSLAAVEAAVLADAEIQAMDKRLSDIDEELAKPVEAADDADLKEAKAVLSAAIDELKDYITIQKKVQSDNEKNNARIAELEHQLCAQNEELARLEKVEFTIQSFSKARTRAIEDNINSLFTEVRFKLFDTQINGAEVECCVPLVEGVPFADANTAGRINAGLDIINAIKRHVGVSAPIFVDGAESVNRLLSTDSQIVKLIVSHDKELVVKAGSKEEKSLFN